MRKIMCPICGTQADLIEVCNEEKTAWICKAACDTLFYIIDRDLVNEYGGSLNNVER